MFRDELDFFIANQGELVDKHPGKVLVLRGRAVVGVYDSVLEAYLKATKLYGPGAFMIQPCQPGPDAYTVTISSTRMTVEHPRAGQ